MENTDSEPHNWLSKGTTNADLMQYLGLEPNEKKHFINLRTMVFSAFDIVFDADQTTDWEKIKPRIKNDVYDKVVLRWVELVKDDEVSKETTNTVLEKLKGFYGYSCICVLCMNRLVQRKKAAKPPAAAQNQPAAAHGAAADEASVTPEGPATWASRGGSSKQPFDPVRDAQYFDPATGL